jgi:hypothetical protein
VMAHTQAASAIATRRLSIFMGSPRSWLVKGLPL